MAIDPASATLAPGFRFHPTDEELVSYYLKRKVGGKPFRFDAISDVDVYKSEPWDLPGQSRLKSRDLEWYFFSVLDRKYGNGSRTNRATERGYWKTTGKDRAVLHRSRTVGMKKTLVYHNGRAPRGERTNWVMHEYRLVDEQLENSGIFQDAFVLCRIFQKSGSGPKNGEQYGAPFVEEEWENDELVMVPGEEAVGGVTFGDDDYLDANDLELVGDLSAFQKKILGVDIPEGDVPPPFSFSSGNNITNVQEPLDLAIDAQALLASMGEIYYDPEQPDDMKLLDLQVQNDMDAIPVKYEDVGESSYTVNSVEPDYLLDEPFIDVANNQFGGGLLDRHDLPNADDEDPHFDEFEEYLAFFDADEYMAFDYENMMGSEDLFAEQSCLTQLDVNGGAQQETMGSQQLTQGLDNDAESSSKLELGKPGSEDTQNPITNRANRVLKDIPAPPAFAAEFPTKEAALLLNSAYRSSTSANFTAGMIQVEDMTLGGNGACWSLGKDADVNDVLLSLHLSPNDSDAAKAEPAASRCWFYLLLSWVLILTTSCKIGSYFYSGNAA